MKKITKTKKILIAEAVFIMGVLIYLFFSTAPSQIYPLSGMTITEPDFVFEIGSGEEVLISIDENFTSPIILKEGSEITLPLGLYYWKVRDGFRESEVKNFTIKGHVGLTLKKREENYELRNSGNVDLNVTKKKEGITSSMTIEIGQSEEIEKEDAVYEGRQR